MAGDSFYDVLTAAISDMIEHGFTDAERVARWQEALKSAAEAGMLPVKQMEDNLRESLRAIYARMIERGAILRHHPGVARFTVERLKPALRVELQKRILASADLIVLNRQQEIARTLRRFSGWASSIPAGGTDVAKRAEVKAEIRKPMAALPYHERLVLTDQGHKFIQSLNDVIASDGGAIAGRWRSHWRQPGYNYREDHKERDQNVYAIRDSWAIRQGLMNKGAGYTDEMTQPAEEVSCLLGNARVPFADRVEVVYRRWYSGELTEIVVESGKTFRATPNHPVLTPDGWLAVGSLNEGDYIIETAEQLIDGSEENKDYAVPTIAEVFCAAREFETSQVTSGKLEQFHGDGSDGNVDIVYAEGKLRVSREFGLEKLREKFCFSMSSHPFASFGSLQFFFDRVIASFGGLVCSLCDRLAIFFGAALESQKAGFGDVAWGYAGSEQSGGYHTTADFELGCERQDARAIFEKSNETFNIDSFSESVSRPILPGQTEVTHALLNSVDADSKGDADILVRFPFETKPTKVIKINRYRGSAHVYNLQTKSGWYVADGVVTHNCRCYYTYLYALRQLPEDMLTKKGAEALASTRVAA